MRCRNCDYPLWNIEARRCPECGGTFSPDEFEFGPHAVRFCCPQCDYPYLGTGPKGHLEPAEFDCLRCHGPVRLAEVIVRPGMGIEERRAQLDVNPWIHRAEHGRISGWFKTIGRAMAAPQQLIRSVPQNHPAFDAWWFGVLTTFLILLVGTVLPYAMYFGMFFFWGFGAGPTMPAFHTGFIMGLVGVFVGPLIAGAIIMTLWPALTLLCLKVMGVGQSTFRDAVQAIGYGAGANVISIVPCCGAYFGWIWWVISSTVMLKERLKIGSVRSSIAVLSFPLLVITLVIGVYVAAFAYQMSSFGGGFAGGTVWTETSNITQAVMVHSSSGTTMGPDHAIELALGGNLTTWSGSGCPFVHSTTSTRASDIPVGESTYAAFEQLSSGEKFAAVAEVLDVRPENLIAHRFGDFVFVHHGAPANMWNAKLWVVVMVPDPDVNTMTSDTHVEVGMSDYSTVTMTYGELLDDLPNQNKIRATHGLPPLTDPGAVTHDAPLIDTSDS